MTQTLAFLALLLATLVGGERRNLPLALGDESVLELRGGSTVKDWSCTTSALRAWVRSAAGAGLAGDLRVPVAALECGDDRMESDLRDAVREDQHPSIAFSLTGWDLAPGAGGFRGVARGRLTLAGVARDVEVAVEGEPDASGGVRAVGRTDLLMTSFGIEPPSALFGLIKARDRVEVRFDLRADAATVARLRALHSPAELVADGDAAGSRRR